MVRLFISHVSKHKRRAAKLANWLRAYTIEAFVAHSSIDVNEDWEHRIRDELNVADVLVALVDRSFRESEWTDQEVGWALGRDIPVVCIVLGRLDPHGFMKRNQALRWNSREPKTIADCIFSDLVKHAALRKKLGDGLVKALRGSGSYEESRKIYERLVLLPSLTRSQHAHIQRAIKENNQVCDANYGKLPGQLCDLIKRKKTTGRAIVTAAPSARTKRGL